MPLRATSMATTAAVVVAALALSPHSARADVTPSAYPTGNTTLSDLSPQETTRQETQRRNAVSASTR